MNRDEYIAQLEQLISFRTVSGDITAANECIAWLTQQTPDAPTVTISRANDFPMLVASTLEDPYGPTDRPHLLYLAHIDVVDGRDEQFEMQLAGDIAYGRGASDMKFSLPIGIHLLERVLDTGLDLDFTLVYTSDEELGGFDGARILADKKKLRPDAVIVPDGGNNWECVNKSKGILHLRLHRAGDPAHGSRPWEGESAIEPLFTVGQKMLDTFGTHNASETWETTVSINRFRGGTQVNKLAAEAYMDIDVRFPRAAGTLDEMRESVARVVQTVDPKVQIEELTSGAPVKTDADNPMLRSYLESMEKAVGRDIAVLGSHGSSDARHFGAYDIPILMSKPNAGGDHGHDEWIDVSSVMKYTEALWNFLEDQAAVR